MNKVILSIIVCTYNREDYLPKTLEHLASQTGDSSQWEVVIVDNNSTDRSAEIIAEFTTSQKGLNFRSFLEINQGHTYARNRGIVEAKGSLISFIDDDAFVFPEYADTIIDFFSTHNEAIALGGKIIPVYEKESPRWMSKFLLPLVAALDKGDNIKKFKGSKFPIGANMAFRSSAFEKYGHFDPELGRRGTGLEGGDEKDVFARLRKNNENIYYHPHVKVHHIIPEKRLTKEYIKGLAIGVGTSEKKRLASQSILTKLGKICEELIKTGGTIVLAILFLLTLEPLKSKMLIKFRFWVIKGFLK